MGVCRSLILQETDADLIDKLHLMEGRYLTRAAVLLFHPDPERFVTGAFVKIGYFLNDADLLYQDEVHGDLFTQVNETMDRGGAANQVSESTNLLQGHTAGGDLPVPEEALREAVTNAIAHKDYAKSVHTRFIHSMSRKPRYCALTRATSVPMLCGLI